MESTAKPAMSQETKTFMFMETTMSSNNQSNWTTPEFTLSAFVAVHGAVKPAQVTDKNGVKRHSIDAEDGKSALFSDKLEKLLLDAASSGQKFKLDHSKLRIRGFKNQDTGAEGFSAYYTSKQESNDFEI